MKGQLGWLLEDVIYEGLFKRNLFYGKGMPQSLEYDILAQVSGGLLEAALEKELSNGM